MLVCHACGAELDLGVNAVVGRRDECGRCRAPLHACRNCSAYDESRQNGCTEPNAEPPRDKAMANFCDFFALKRGPMQAGEVDKSAEARAALDALFSGKGKGSPAPSPADDDPKARAKRALDELFKK